MRWLGRLLKNVHAGEKHLAFHHAAVRAAPATIALTSPAFAAGAAIPKRHAGKGVGDDISPALAWSGVPAEAKELVIIMEDPDAPVPRPFTHFALTLPASRASLAEGEVARGKETAGTRLGKNSVGRLDYMGPRPVPGHGPHRYVFQIFALDRDLGIDKPLSKNALLERMAGSVVARGRLDGVYER